MGASPLRRTVARRSQGPIRSSSGRRIGDGIANQSSWHIVNRLKMSESCPDCGASVEYRTRTTQVLAGTCGDCGETFTIIHDGPTTAGTEAAGVETASAEAPSEKAATRPPRSPVVSPNCPDCDAALVLQSANGPAIQATCPECRSKFTYLLTSAPAVEMSSERRRPRSSSDDRGDNFSSRSARPCRECGGMLKFTTGPDGTVQGECTSCGNRFKLPPREDRGDRRGRFSKGPRASGGWSGGSRREGAPRYGSSRPYRRRDSPERGGDDSPRPRRGR
jgi:DNA-directed RNA polymerase subunit M/transcription elongation factor TFIIS